MAATRALCWPCSWRQLSAFLKEKPHPDAVQTCGTSHISSFPRDHANKCEAQGPEMGGSLAVGFCVLIPIFFLFSLSRKGLVDFTILDG